MRYLERLQKIVLLLLVIFPVALAVLAGLRTGMERADFVFVNQGEVSSLDPALATGIPEGRIITALFEGLTALDPERLEPMPACAESWTISEDGLKVRFRIRDGLEWSNGDPLTSEDFLFSWLRLLDPETASPYAYLLWRIEGAKAFSTGQGSQKEVGMEAPNPRTFSVRLETRCPYFLLLTAYYPLFPVHPGTLTGGGAERWLSPEKIVTNGPFQVEARLLKDRIRLRRNDRYWDRANVALSTIDALAVTSPITALNLYLTGEVDWINKVPPHVLPYVQDRLDFTLCRNLGTNFLRFNTTYPPLNDARVRRALHLATDKEALIRYVLKGGQEPASSFVPPGIPGYHPPEVEFHDPAGARRLLAEAGFPDGRGFPELNLLYSSEETNRDLAEVISMQWKTNLGIKVHPAGQERKGYFVSQNTLAYHICLSSWLGDYLDASTFLEIFLEGSGNNRTGWMDRAYDELLAEAAREGDRSARAALMRRAEKILLDELPVAPLYFRTTANMIHPCWEGYHDNILDFHPLKHLIPARP